MGLYLHGNAHKGDKIMDSKREEDVELHIKIPRDLIDELTLRADERRMSRTELIEDSLREHLRRIKALENVIAVKEQEMEQLKDEIQPCRDMIGSLVEDLLQRPTNIGLGWEYERIATFFIRALTRYEHLYCPIEAWRKIKEALPPNRRNPFSPLSDYEQLCKILYPADPYYFERCLQSNKDIYLVTL